MKVCTFSGHRPQKFPWKFNENDSRCVLLKAKLFQAISDAIQCGYDYFIVGGALGWDMWAAEAVLAQRAEHDLTLEIAQPFNEHNSKLYGEYQFRQQTILYNANKITVISSRDNWKNAYKLRNQYMIDHSERLITACLDEHTRSGTAQTIHMAQKANIEIIRLDWENDDNYSY